MASLPNDMKLKTDGSERLKYATSALAAATLAQTTEASKRSLSKKSRWWSRPCFMLVAVISAVFHVVFWIIHSLVRVFCHIQRVASNQMLSMLGNDLVASAAFPLAQVREGVRWVPLLDRQHQPIPGCGLLVHVEVLQEPGYGTSWRQWTRCEGDAHDHDGVADGVADHELPDSSEEDEVSESPTFALEPLERELTLCTI